MTHDLLCPYRPAQSGICDHPFSDPNVSCAVFHISRLEIPCQCDLIAKIRADTLSKVREVVRQLPSTKVISYDDETWHEPAIIERGKVIAAIDALRSKQ